MLNSEIFIRRFSWSIDPAITAQSWNVRRSLKTQKKSFKSLLGFKVDQGHRCWHYRKARLQCLLLNKQQVCTYLQPLYDKRVHSGKITTSWGVTLFALLAQLHEVLSPKTKSFVAAHGDDFVILTCTVFTRQQDVTDTRTLTHEGTTLW